jgi:hypothetical protein
MRPWCWRRGHRRSERTFSCEQRSNAGWLARGRFSVVSTHCSALSVSGSATSVSYQLPENAAEHVDEPPRASSIQRPRMPTCTQPKTVTVAAERLLGGNAPSSVNYEEMSRALPALIKEKTREHEDADVLTVYDVLYRSHSTHDAHPWKIVGST